MAPDLGRVSLSAASAFSLISTFLFLESFLDGDFFPKGFLLT
jgi:hypothetical protein